MCSDWESKQRHFGLQAGPQSTAPHHPGHIAYFLKASICDLVFFELCKLLFLLLVAHLIFLLFDLCLELSFLQRSVLITFFDAMSMCLIVAFSCSLALSFWSVFVLGGVFLVYFSVPFLLFPFLCLYKSCAGNF